MPAIVHDTDWIGRGQNLRSGVDRISVGALTHSAVALDLGLDIPSARADLTHQP